MTSLTRLGTNPLDFVRLASLLRLFSKLSPWTESINIEGESFFDAHFQKT